MLKDDDGASKSGSSEGAGRTTAMNVPWPEFTRETLWDRIAWACVLLGVLMIIASCFCSMMMKNPGGPPVSLDEERRANLLAVVGCGVGAVVGVVVPVAVMLRRTFLCHARKGEEQEKSN
jgi:hypothetical protein